MQVISKIACPVCGNRFAPKNPAIGDIIRCPSCTLDLKIIGREPLTAVIDNSWEEDTFNLGLKKAKMTNLKKVLREEAA